MGRQDAAAAKDGLVQLPEYEHRLGQELKGWQTRIGALLRFGAIIAGALYNAYPQA